MRRKTISLKPQGVGPIPEATVRVAHAAFPKGNAIMRLRDALGPIYTDEQFRTLFPHDGQPTLSPGLLALVTVLQFSERLSGVRRTFDDKLISLMRESVHLSSKRDEGFRDKPIHHQ